MLQGIVVYLLKNIGKPFLAKIFTLVIDHWRRGRYDWSLKFSSGYSAAW